MPLGIGFDKLPTKEKVRCYYNWGFTYNEIGEYFGMTKGWAWAHVHNVYVKRRTKRLRKAYQIFFESW